MSANQPEIRTCIKTLNRFIHETTHDSNLMILMDGIGTACKSISNAVRIAGIANLYGAQGSVNASGDDVKKLDILSNEIMMDCLIATNLCHILVSEENELPIIANNDDFHCLYSVAFDPLDGSSNIDCNVSTGTIFSVFRSQHSSGSSPVDDILRCGRDVLVAGYCMYGSATELVLAISGKVCKFSLDPSIGEFILTINDLKMPLAPKKIYSINEGNCALWDRNVSRAICPFRQNLDSSSAGYSLRYVGSMVSDVHRTLLYGGVFMYPADAKSRSGKLRVLYEVFPMAAIIESAGGLAYRMPYHDSDDCIEHVKLLDMVPRSIHERSGMCLGSIRDVRAVLSAYPTSVQEHKQEG